MSNSTSGTTPAAPAPPGQTSNLVDPPNRDSQIYGYTITCIILSTVFVAGRIYTRFFIIKSHGWQDYLVLLTWPLAVTFMLLLALAVPNGLGLHVWDMSQDTFVELNQLAAVLETIYIPVMCTVKLAILVQIGAIFVSSLKTRLRWVLWIFGAAIVIFFTILLFIELIICIPWQKTSGSSVTGHCLKKNSGIISSAAVNVAIDLVLFALPVERTWRLQMSRRKKVAVSAVFVTGFFTVICSIMRLVQSVYLLTTNDFIYILTTTGLWAAEMTSALVVCCLPVMPQFYKAHISSTVDLTSNKFRSSLSRRRGGTSGSVSSSAGSRNTRNTWRRGTADRQHEYEELQNTQPRRPAQAKAPV